MDYSKTVNLPKTDFPMKAELPKREPERLKKWEETHLYEAMQENRKDADLFVLHDGPPYANGNIHIGHVLNKVLKDIVVKYKAMTGFRAPYVPGWDCHGLPIENALIKEKKINKQMIDRLPFRKDAAAYAQKYIDLQREEFKRLGILGEWTNPYITMAKDYSATVVQVFRELSEKRLIVRHKKPVWWCASCETALAEAEIEYQDRQDTAIYVAFPIQESFILKLSDVGQPSSVADIESIRSLAKLLKQSSIVIWTTTPWTLPANRAIAYNSQEYYVAYKATTGMTYIVAEKRLDAFVKTCQLQGELLRISDTAGYHFLGSLFQGVSAVNIEGRSVPLLSADFVTMDTGTGLVHIAPGHGEEDYRLGIRQGLELFSPVDERGLYTSEVFNPEWVGRFVLKIGDEGANNKVIAYLMAHQKLVGQESLTHSYPHCWRCHNPLITRGTEQYFLQIDSSLGSSTLRQALLQQIDQTTWSPSHAQGKDRIGGMVQKRPDWCLSRQRHWGTPIPTLLCSNKECGQWIVAEKAEDLIRSKGSDAWFESKIEELTDQRVCLKCKAPLQKENDILDVWFDSGASFEAVLHRRDYLKGSKDVMYLEGSDQHRGWFQVSLILSVALNAKAPFTEVLTHGFVVDGQGRKMSKSLGNVVAPQQIIKEYGAEILRFWVASSNYAEDIRLSPDLIKVYAEGYRKIRNTLRYLLGNLSDFDPSLHSVRDLKGLDEWVMFELDTLVYRVRRHCESRLFHSAMNAISEFCGTFLSSFYLDILKDQLYTLKIDSVERRSAQTVLYAVTDTLLKMLAPFLSFTAEEGWELFKKDAGSIFLQEFPKSIYQGKAHPDEQKWIFVQNRKDLVNKLIEEKRKTNALGKSNEAWVTFRKTGKIDILSNKLNFLSPEEWEKILMVSKVNFEELPGDSAVLVRHAQEAGHKKCARCWNWRSDVGQTTAFPDACGRCVTVLNDLSEKGLVRN